MRKTVTTLALIVVAIVIGMLWTSMRAQDATVILNGSGLRLAHGSVVLDGSNPTPVTTGLVNISRCMAVDRRTTAPGDEVNGLTVAYTAGTLNVYAWTNTTGTDPTLIASADSDDVIDWFCLGT